MKFGLIAGAAAACVVMSGCKAPRAQVSARPAKPAAQVTVSEPAPVAPVEKEVAAPAPAPEAPRCKCAPGTVHTSPCACGAIDCACKVMPAEPEYTIYRVKGGDMLSSICATYGLKQSKVLALNPGMDANKLFVGKKIKLPGKIALKDADTKSLAKPTAKKQAKPAKKVSSRASAYSGATKEYVVKSGDSLGKIAYDNGITVKCLKELNGLKKNMIRIGQKLKVPAEKPVADKKSAEAKPAEVKPVDAKPADAKPTAENNVKDPVPVVEPAVEPAVAPQQDAGATNVEANPEPPKVDLVKEEPAKEEPAAALTHTVKAGEDIVSIAIQYGLTPSPLMDLNNLKNTDVLTPGQVIKLPPEAKLQ
ncbi:MAG: LysM peptidoglycan-binding domain-containing protein [Kiritimatiellae bacterium]|nr:LysM peptidoglycan-binding domain-containing protein [Kiritimatiellia bacterium]